MLKKLNILVLFTLISLPGFSQRFTKFTEDPETFIKEMDAFFERSNTNYKKGNDLLKVFEKSWFEGGYSAEKQKSVYELANLLLKKRALNFPHFYNYISALIAFDTITTNPQNYIEWEKSLKFLTNNRKTKLNDLNNFLEGTIYLLQENTVYHSLSVRWISNNNNYQIKLDGDTVKFIFPKLDLTGIIRKDSIKIHETSGTFYPITSVWKGSSAKTYWDKANIPRNICWAEIPKYSFVMKKGSYTIKNVKFYNKEYFDFPILGTLTDKITEFRSAETTSYPRFESNEAEYKIKNIFTDIDYQGGFSMQGNTFIGTGSKKNPATISVFRDAEVVVNNDTIMKKELFLKTYSFYYSFKKDEITSQNAKVSMYIDEDSIYHPGLLFRYYDNNREINLIRNDDPKNMSRSPYYNSYHQIEMDFELFTWKIEETEILLTMLKGSSINIANFESTNYFSAAKYYEAQGYEDIHPYISLRRYAKKHGKQSFYVDDLAKFMRMPKTPVKRLLIKLTYTGIVNYDFETDFCTIKPKLYKYLDAIVGKEDYDLINLESRTNSPEPNAILNLKNMDLVLKGVPEINVSDSQNVIFFPKNKQILLKKNRDFDFEGKIEAGLLSYYGQNFQFKYDSFKVVLNDIDSLNIKVKDGVDAWGRRVLTSVENSIENVTGDLLIDDPNNKSGVKKFPHYPIFQSKKDSYVYYDDKNIEQGKYTRNNFYFKIDPYTIDSLNDFSIQGMGYDGELHSADIFPVIREKLILQKDNSLGFHHDSPKDGFPVYKNKGQYFAKVHLSNQGLRGNGELKYLTSTTKSNDFIFYPDSTNAYALNFDIKKQTGAVQYPKVKAENNRIHWTPYKDLMIATSIKAPFNMYETQAQHSGTLLYSPKWLKGKGKTSYFKGVLSSNMYTYQSDKFSTDTANFELESINKDKLAFKSDNVNAKVSFIDYKSEFKSNDGTIKAELPENLYETYIDEFTWMMKDKTMQLSNSLSAQNITPEIDKLVKPNEKGTIPKGALFLSVHKGQDSLNWISAKADFNLTNNTIFAHKVDYIHVADAEISPNEGDVTIEPMAKMKTLEKAKILANTDTKYHRFHDATINISSRKKYHAEGKYNYIDELKQKQVINFNLIAVDSIGQTFGRGKVKETEDFSLSPAFAYQGNVNLKSQIELLTFDGYTKINHECSKIPIHWAKFESEIDPLDIYIPIQEDTQNPEDKRLASGVMMATDSVHVFPSFLSPKKTYSNNFVATANGFLTYKKDEKKYYIAEKYRLENPDTTGSILSLYTSFCNMYQEGSIDLSANLGQLKVITKGNANYDLPKDKVKLDLIMTVDFFFPDEIISCISDTMSRMTNLSAISLKYRTYEMGLKELLGPTEANKMLKEQAIFGKVKKVPEKLATTFVFSELNMDWNDKTRAWQSKGDLGIVNILGNQINKKVKGNLEIDRKRSGDSFTLYIEFSQNHWYFFTYKRGLMQAYSSEKKFNSMIADVKQGDRKMKINRGEDSFAFFLSNKRKRDLFLKKISEGGSSSEQNDEEQEEDQNNNKKDNNKDNDSKQYDDFD